MDNGTDKARNFQVYAPGLAAVPGLNAERIISIGDFWGSQCYTAQDLNDRDVKNREYCCKSPDRQNGSTSRMFIMGVKCGKPTSRLDSNV